MATIEISRLVVGIMDYQVALFVAPNLAAFSKSSSNFCQNHYAKCPFPRLCRLIKSVNRKFCDWDVYCYYNYQIDEYSAVAR